MAGLLSSLMSGLTGATSPGATAGSGQGQQTPGVKSGGLLDMLTQRHKVYDEESLASLVEVRGSEKLGIAPIDPQALAAQNAALEQAATGDAQVGAAAVGAATGSTVGASGVDPNAAANTAAATTAAATGAAAVSPQSQAQLQAALTQAAAAQVWTDGGAAAAGTAGAPAISPLGSNQTAIDAATAAATDDTSAPTTTTTTATTATTTTTAPTVATPTVTETTNAGTVTGAGTAAATTTTTTPTTAPKLDFWNSHIAQFKGKYLPDGPDMRPNCGPASVTMALRMIGLDIPGFSGQRNEAVLDKARVLATGKNDVSVGTTDSELERLITASGGKWSESNNLDQILGWVGQGVPVILAGNPAKGWNQRYSKDQVYPFDGGHWVTVSGYDEKSGHWVVNDPLSQIGPILVSRAELANYMNSHGGLGIGVFK